MTEDQRRIHQLELENVSLRKRVLILEGAHKVLNTRILGALNGPRSEIETQD